MENTGECFIPPPSNWLAGNSIWERHIFSEPIRPILLGEIEDIPHHRSDSENSIYLTEKKLVYFGTPSDPIRVKVKAALGNRLIELIRKWNTSQMVPLLELDFAKILPSGIWTRISFDCFRLGRISRQQTRQLSLVNLLETLIHSDAIRSGHAHNGSGWNPRLIHLVLPSISNVCYSEPAETTGPVLKLVWRFEFLFTAAPPLIPHFEARWIQSNSMKSGIDLVNQRQTDRQTGREGPREGWI